jgi:hypothetical protein
MVVHAYRARLVSAVALPPGETSEPSARIAPLCWSELAGPSTLVQASRFDGLLSPLRAWQGRSRHFGRYLVIDDERKGSGHFQAAGIDRKPAADLAFSIWQ